MDVNVQASPFVQGGLNEHRAQSIHLNEVGQADMSSLQMTLRSAAPHDVPSARRLTDISALIPALRKECYGYRKHSLFPKSR
jgi:hypothetical protein